MKRLLARLRQHTSGVAMTEFALAAPLLMTAGLYGAETTWLTVTHMRVNQAALEIADDASRIGDLSTLTSRKIYESDINELFYGAHLEGGELDLFTHGRVILSSLEVYPDSDPPQQYIHWQRCKGMLNVSSTYGEAGDGIGDAAFTGMGPVGNKVMAMEDDAVMFVEIAYDYQALFGDIFVSNQRIVGHAAFNVRSDRDLSQVYQRDAFDPDPVATCGTYDGYIGGTLPTVGSGGSAGTSSTSSTSTSSSSTSGGTSSGSSTSGGATSSSTSGGASSSSTTSGGATSSSTSGGPGV